MPNYNESVIYKIYCKNPEVKYTYFGSTTRFAIRKHSHKVNCIDMPNKRLYKTINENGGWDNWTMAPIEQFPCENRMALNIREQFWIDSHNQGESLNQNRAYISDEDLRKRKVEIATQWIKNNRERHNINQKRCRDRKILANPAIEISQDSV